MKFRIEIKETRTATPVVEVAYGRELDRALREAGTGLSDLLNGLVTGTDAITGFCMYAVSDREPADLHVDARGNLDFVPPAKALPVPEVQKAPAPTPTVDIALLIWQRNRVADLIADSLDRVDGTVIEAWDGIVNLIDSIIDEAHPVGTQLPPPYRPWKESGPATTRQCFIDYIDSNGGMSEDHNLWAEYSEYCREAGVDPLIKET